MILDDTNTVNEVAAALKADLDPFTNQPADKRTLSTLQKLVNNRLTLSVKSGFIYDYVLLNTKQLFDMSAITEEYEVHFTVGIKVRNTTDFYAVPVMIQLSKPGDTQEEIA